MGKIADRFAKKKDPLYVVSKAIVSSASKFVEKYDGTYADELDKTLEFNLNNLDRKSFDTLLECISANTNLKNGREELREVINNALKLICETGFMADNLQGRLFTIPLAVVGKTVAAETVISQEMHSQTTDVLIEHGLIAEDAEVVYLPRLISQDEGSLIGFHEAYQILKLMSVGDARAAAQVVVQARFKAETDFSEASAPFSEDKLSCGLLVGYLKSKSDECFPLDSKCESVLLEAQCNTVDSEFRRRVGDRNNREAELTCDDTRKILDIAGTCLASVLKVSKIVIGEPPSGWFDGVKSAGNLERCTAAGMIVQKIIKSHGDGEPKSIFFGEHVATFEDPPAIGVNIFSAKDGSKLGLLRWNSLRGERYKETVDSLFSYLKTAGVNSRV